MTEPKTWSHYHIQLGHAHVQVEGVSLETALNEARRQLSIEYPRLWNVIYEADEKDFQIAPRRKAA